MILFTKLLDAGLTSKCIVGRIMKEDEFAIFVLQLLPAYDVS